MRKFILLVFIIFVSVLSGFSQREIKEGLVVDRQAQKIITDLSSKLKAESPISFNFMQITDNGSEEGSVKINGNKYMASFLGNIIYCNGKNISIYQKEINEVTINSMEDADNEILNITKFISEANINFRPKLIREEGPNYIIDLSPNKRSEYYKIRIKVGAKSYRINSMEIHYRRGGIHTYNISNYNTKVISKDSDYSFNKKDFPLVEIIDLR